MKQCGADEAGGIGCRDLSPGLSRRGLAEDSQRWKTNWDFLDENFSPGKDLPGSHRDATRRNHQDGKCLTGTLDGNDRTGRRPEAGSSERFSTTRIRLVLIVRGLRQKGIGRRSYLSIWDRAEEETGTISGTSERKTRFRHCDNCDINYIERRERIQRIEERELTGSSKRDTTWRRRGTLRTALREGLITTRYLFINEKLIKRI